MLQPGYRHSSVKSGYALERLCSMLERFLTHRTGNIETADGIWEAARAEATMEDQGTESL